MILPFKKRNYNIYPLFLPLPLSIIISLIGFFFFFVLLRNQVAMEQMAESLEALAELSDPSKQRWSGWPETIVMEVMVRFIYAKCFSQSILQAVILSDSSLLL